MEDFPPLKAKEVQHLSHGCINYRGHIFCQGAAPGSASAPATSPGIRRAAPPSTSPGIRRASPRRASPPPTFPFKHVLGKRADPRSGPERLLISAHLSIKITF